MRDSEFNWDEYWAAFPLSDNGLPVITEIDPDRKPELSPELKQEIDRVREQNRTDHRRVDDDKSN